MVTRGDRLTLQSKGQELGALALDNSHTFLISHWETDVGDCNGDNLAIQ